MPRNPCTVKIRFQSWPAACLALIAAFTHLAASTHTDKIRVDQFGYLPTVKKVAVVADPQQGWNSAESYTPGTTLEVRRINDDALVFSGTPQAWGGGAVHEQSGDRVWWFDFTALTDPGEYRIHDPANNAHSDRFAIRDDVYDQVLRDAVRVFFHQRSNFAKEPPFADPKWADAASHTQDTTSRPINDQGNAALERDLRGAWFDAGDYNKYTEWTGRVIVELLLAYVRRPDAFPDDFNLPESGNGIPDLLDEIKWGLDWLLRMQLENGALLGKLAVTGFQSAYPPSADNHLRYYGPVSTEATAIAAAAFALGAMVFEDVGMASYATTLDAAALAAWNWTQANPDVQFDNSGFASANPARDAYGRMMNRIAAAVMLFDRTGNPAYRQFVDDRFNQANPIRWTYFYAFESDIQNVLAHYAGLPNATPAVTSDIGQRMQASVAGAEFSGAWTGQQDAYRAYLKDDDYVWGSNRAKANKGIIFLNVNRLDIDPGNADSRRDAAYGFLHYLHGVNPIAMVYLSNMGAAGATRSANEIYHNWFAPGSDWSNALTSPKGPAPGYLTGGPNRYYGGSVNAIRQQPVQKAYLDWNAGWPGNSWEITEPAIYYQAAYIHLLSSLMPVATGGPGGGLVTAWPSAATITFGEALAMAGLGGGAATVPGSFAFASPSAMPPAGTAFHRVVFTPEDLDSYSPEERQVPVTVLKAPATVELANLEHTYDGMPKTAAAATDPPGLPVAITYNGSTAAPVQAGNYHVVAAITSPNHEGTATATLSIAPGTSPPPGELVVYRDASTLITGTWGDGLQEQLTGGFEGSKHYRYDYNIQGWWAGVGLNLDSWGGGNRHDVSGYGFLRMAVQGPSEASHQLLVRLASPGVEGPLVAIARQENYAHVEVPLTGLVGGSNLDLGQISEIHIALGGVPSGGGGVFFDDIVFVSTEPPDAYELWAGEQGIQGGPGDRTNGVPNLLRYAFGGTIDTPASALQVELLEAPGDHGPSLVATFPRVADPKLSYRLRVSHDLQDWGSEPFWEGSGDSEAANIALPDDSVRRFVRLEVSRH